MGALNIHYIYIAKIPSTLQCPIFSDQGVNFFQKLMSYYHLFRLSSRTLSLSLCLYLVRPYFVSAVIEPGPVLSCDTRFLSHDRFNPLVPLSEIDQNSFVNSSCQPYENVLNRFYS
jgi:hypothetical protein